ncbi:helix-turn-helix domain-containing protein, partial [Clostridium perfringens]
MSIARTDAGTEELLTREEVDELLAAATPLAFWRRKRGLTQASLAAKADIAQGFLSEIEAGKKTGDLKTLRKLADTLRVTLDDLTA